MNRLLRRSIKLAQRSAYFLRTGYVQTGERVNPDFPDENFQNHFKVYRFLEQFVAGKDVLDIGSGTGYGTAHLGGFAKSVVGIDISPRAIRFARKRYPATRFELMDAQALTFEPASFDVAISTENFEHLGDQEKHLREIVKVLRPDGMCFIATPNRNVALETNRYHTHEFTAEELREMLLRHFGEVEVWPSMMQTPDAGSLVRPAAGSLRMFGKPVDGEWVSNTHSLFSFSRGARK